MTRKTKQRQKKYNDEVMSASFDVIVVFLFMANLEQPASRIPEA